MNQLVSTSEADANLGFMARLMALCSLPRTNPGNQHQYKRVNGPYKLIMIAGGDSKLPFGNLPRLILAWVSTEAVRTQSRVLVLGDSLSEFMRELGIYSTSGRGHIRLRNQMRRLFQCHVQFGLRARARRNGSFPRPSPTKGNFGGTSASPTSGRCGKLDLYLWAVYRTFSLTRPQRLSWRSLYRQFGVGPSPAGVEEDQVGLAGLEHTTRRLRAS